MTDPAEHTYTLTLQANGKYLILGDQDPPTRIEFEPKFAPQYLNKWLQADDAECAVLLEEVRTHGKATRTIRWDKFFTFKPSWFPE